MKKTMTEQMFANAILQVIMENSYAKTIDEAFEVFENMATINGSYWMKKSEENNENKETYEKLYEDFMRMSRDCFKTRQALK